MAFAAPKTVPKLPPSSQNRSTLFRRPSVNSSILVPSTPASIAKTSKMGPPPSTVRRPSRASICPPTGPRSSLRARIDSRSSDCDTTFNDLQIYMNFTQGTNVLQEEADTVMAIYDDYLMSELILLNAETANKKAEKEIEHQIAVVWTQVEELRKKAQIEERKNESLKILLDYYVNTKKSLDKVEPVLKNYTDFFKTFDPLICFLARCKNHLQIKGLEVTEETQDYTILVKILNERLSLLDKLKTANPDLTGIVQDDETTDLFGKCLERVFLKLCDAKNCFSELMDILERTEQSALYVASLMISERQLEEAETTGNK